MKTLYKSIIGYKNNRVELVKLDKGEKTFYVCNGCTPYILTNSIDEAYSVYRNKEKALKAERTRELNKLRNFIITNADNLEKDLIESILLKDFHLSKESVENMFIVYNVK